MMLNHFVVSCTSPNGSPPLTTPAKCQLVGSLDYLNIDITETTTAVHESTFACARLLPVHPWFEITGRCGSYNPETAIETPTVCGDVVTTQRHVRTVILA